MPTPLGPICETLPLGCQREAAAALWCLSETANCHCACLVFQAPSQTYPTIVSGSPLAVTVLPAAAEVSCCELRAAAPGTAAEPLCCVAGQPAVLDLLSRDALRNPCGGGGERFEVTLEINSR